MVVWSALRTLVSRSTPNAPGMIVAKRAMSGHERTFALQPSRWQWNKYKDFFHFYAMLGVIPLTALVVYCNIFIGPGTLSEIPEGYVPKHWEYERHPISRFIARYITNNPQQEYEKYLHYLYEESERIEIRKIEERVQDMMKERLDYKAYYYRPVTAKYHRVMKDTAEYLKTIHGD